MGIDPRTKRSVLECGGRALKGRRHRFERTQDSRSSQAYGAFALRTWHAFISSLLPRTKAVSRISACHRTPRRWRDSA